jgi:hypothetical protein
MDAFRFDAMPLVEKSTVILNEKLYFALQFYAAR